MYDDDLPDDDLPDHDPPDNPSSNDGLLQHLPAGRRCATSYAAHAW